MKGHPGRKIPIATHQHLHHQYSTDPSLGTSSATGSTRGSFSPSPTSPPSTVAQPQPQHHQHDRTKSTFVRTSSWCRIFCLSFGGGYWVATILWTLQQYRPVEIQQNYHHHQQQFKQSFLQAEQGDIKSTTSSDEPRDDTIRLSTTSTISSTTNATRYSSPAIIGSTPTFQQKQSPDPNWWINFVPKLARVWNPRTVDSWCRELLEFPPTPVKLGHEQVATGMIYIKLYKASSSTCEGIARTIAHRVGNRQWWNQKQQQQQQQQKQQVQAQQDSNNTDHQQYVPALPSSSVSIMCPAWTRHEFANHHMHARRHPTQSLLWTFVRHPSSRDISHIYHFEIGRREKIFTDEDIQSKIQGHIMGLQARYLVPIKTRPTPLWPRHELRKNRTKVINILKTQIFDNYDFVGLTERMSESLACMVLLWDLQPPDVIVLNAKRSGGYDDGGGDGKNHNCTKIPKLPPISPQLATYFETRHPIWNADFLLYNAVNASLELTMDVLGRDRVHSMARTIERLQQIAQETCEGQAYFPCSPDGVFQPQLAEQSCYVQDSGCGHECIHRTLANVTWTGSNGRTSGHDEHQSTTTTRE